MASPLARYTSSPFQGGPAAADTNDFMDQLSDSRDFFKKVGVQKEQEAQRVANNISAADLMQMGDTVEQMKAGRDDYFAQIARDPNVDVNAAMKNYNDRITTLSSEVERASQTKAYEAQEELAQYNLTQAKLGVEDKRRIKAGSDAFNKFYHGGGFDAEAQVALEAEAKRLKMTPDQVLMFSPQFIEDWKGDRLTDPDYLPNMAAKYDMSPDEFEQFNQVGQDFATTKADARALALDNANKSQKAQEIFDTAQVNYAQDKADQISWNGTDWTWQKPVSTMADGRAERYAKEVGVDADDEVTGEVIARLHDNFPESTAFKHMLDVLRGPDRRSKLTYADIDTIAQERANLKSRAQKEINDRNTAPRQGGSAEENLRLAFEAYNSTQQTPATTTGGTGGGGTPTIPTTFEAKLEEAAGPEPEKGDLPEQQAYYEKSADTIEEAFNAMPPHVLAKGGGDKMRRYLRKMRTGYSTPGKLSLRGAAGYAERKTTREKALQLLKEMQSIESYYSKLSQQGQSRNEEREFINALNK